MKISCLNYDIILTMNSPHFSEQPNKRSREKSDADSGFEPDKKKIIFLITKSNWGGAQKYVFDLATGLSKDRYSVKVVLGGNGILKYKLLDAGIPVIALNGLERDVSAGSLGRELKVFNTLLRIFKDEKPDIIHLNSSKISGLGSFAGRLAGVPQIIFTAHGWAFNENRSALSKLLITTAYIMTLWFSHQTIGVSKGVIGQISNWPCSKKKMHVVHNGIHAPNFLDRDAARAILLEKIGLERKSHLAVSSDTIWFGGIGELHHIKGHIYAIRAFAKLAKDHPNLNFIYIIFGEGEYRDEIEAEINRQDLHSRVILLGHVQDAATYLKALDFYIFPSLSEGLAYAVIEAGFAKLPIITSNVGGIPEIISNSENGFLIPSKNSDAIKRAIETYLDNPELAEKHAQAICKTVSAQFSIKKMIEKTENVYLLRG